MTCACHARAKTSVTVKKQFPLPLLTETIQPIPANCVDRSKTLSSIGSATHACLQLQSSPPSLRIGFRIFPNLTMAQAARRRRFVLDACMDDDANAMEYIVRLVSQPDSTVTPYYALAEALRRSTKLNALKCWPIFSRRISTSQETAPM